jgi:hypothetical protein
MLAPPTAAQLRKRKLHKTLLICLASLVALVLLSAGLIHLYVGRDLRQATALTDDFVAALRAGDIEQAYDDGSVAFKNTVARDQLEDASLQLKQHIGGQTLQASATNMTKTDAGVHAAVVYTTDEPRPSYYLRIVLDKTGDQKWLVRNFVLSAQPLEAIIK